MLTIEQAQEIRKAHYEHGESRKQLAARFGVSVVSIGRVCKNKTHKSSASADGQLRHVTLTMPTALFSVYQQFAAEEKETMSTIIVEVLRKEAKFEENWGYCPTLNA